jgi:hypothetical protein
MEQGDIEDRLSLLEKRLRLATAALCGSGAVALIALVAAVWALIPILRVQHALREFARSSYVSEAEPHTPVITHANPSNVESQHAPPESHEAANKLLSAMNVAVKSKRLLPVNYDAGRYSPEVELALEARNNSDRKVRAYQGTLDVRDLLGNPIILLEIKDQTPVGPHETHRFEQYFEINKFIDRDTRFAAEQFGNLRFNWKPEKIVFSDGTTVGLSEK